MSIMRVEINDDNKPRLCSVQNEFPLSTHLFGTHGSFGNPPPIISFIDHIKMYNPGVSVICVGYSDAVGGDTQIGFTGSCGVAEHSRYTVIREAREELGLNVQPEAITYSVHAKGCSLFGIDANKVMPDNSTVLSSNTYQTYSGSKKWKAFGLIYGSQEQLIKLMQTPTTRIESLDQQNIDHVLLIHIDEICKMIHAIVTSNSKKRDVIMWSMK